MEFSVALMVLRLSFFEMDMSLLCRLFKLSSFLGFLEIDTALFFFAF